MSKLIAIAPVRKTVVVQATPQRAFDVFTAKIDRWWPKSHGIGPSPVRESVIEPFVGGRWFSSCEDGTVVTLGHVRVWQPGRREDAQRCRQWLARLAGSVRSGARR